MQVTAIGLDIAKHVFRAILNGCSQSLLAGLARSPTSRQSSQAAYRGEAIPMSQSRLQSRNIRGAISHGGDKAESTHLTVLGNGTDDWLCLGWGSWVSTVDATGYTDQPRHGAS